MKNKKRIYWYLTIGAYGQPDGDIREIELTKDEFLKMKEEYVYIYDNYYSASLRAND